MIRFRFRYTVAGGHTHVRVFAGDATSLNATLGKCGELTFRNEEWEQFREQFKRANVEFLPDQIT